MIEPGEIYTADFDQAGRHPVIVVSREDLNRGNYALVVVCTSARFATRRGLPNCVPFLAGQFGFTRDCVAQCENMLSIDKAQLDLAAGPTGKLDDVRRAGRVEADDGDAAHASLRRKAPCLSLSLTRKWRNSNGSTGPPPTSDSRRCGAPCLI
jgi:mRNA-degrading endonuclease toxin of MazEF toxin-antitoxin module